MARASLSKFCAGIALLLAVSFPAHALITFPTTSWAELSSEQKIILAPLSRDWDAMELQRQMKWLGIAQRYSSMTPDEKVRTQDRMKEWARLSPMERRVARDGFASIQRAPQEVRGNMKETIKQQWQIYQELPESEKARLRMEATRNSGTVKTAPTIAR
jgi:hypothetical protein